jgi:hypothetical protein
VATYKDPLEARQLRQWQREDLVGKDDASMEILIVPQLHSPLIFSFEEVIGIVVYYSPTEGRLMKKFSLIISAKAVLWRSKMITRRR